jgi:hypothetical protein
MIHRQVRSNSRNIRAADSSDRFYEHPLHRADRLAHRSCRSARERVPLIYFRPHTVRTMMSDSVDYFKHQTSRIFYRVPLS